MMEGMAAIITTQQLEGSTAISKVHRRVSMLFDGLVPAQEAEEEDEKGLAAVPGSAESTQDGLQTNGEAMLNLLNNCLGSGMLGMGFCIAQMGLVMGLLVMVFSALVNKKTLMLNLTTSKWANAKPASTEVGSIAFGGAGQMLLVLMVVLMAFFCCVSYVDACADAVSGLLSTILEASALPSNRTLAIICWVLLLVPPTFIRSMSMVAMLSFFAFIGGSMIVVSLTCVCLQELSSKGLPPMTSIRLFPASAAGFLNAFPILVLVFSVQAGGDVVLVTMKDASEPNMVKVVNITYSIVLVMLYFIGALCYITFLDNTHGDVLQNFSSTSIPGIVARIASLDLVVLSYMIMMIPCRVSLIDILFGKNEALQESTLSQFYGTTLVLNVLALLFALAVSDLSLVLGIDGAICTNFVAFLMPVAFWLKIQARPKDEQFQAVPIISPRNVPFVIIFFIGLTSLILSTNQIVQRVSGS
jgi:amino acid permease